MVATPTGLAPTFLCANAGWQTPVGNALVDFLPNLHFHTPLETDQDARIPHIPHIPLAMLHEPNDNVPPAQSLLVSAR